MLPNIDRALYSRFKREGYRKKQYAEAPVISIEEIVNLGYLDVNRKRWGHQTVQGKDQGNYQSYTWKEHRGDCWRTGAVPEGMEGVLRFC